MRVIVCGGRDFTDVGRVWNGLSHFHGQHGPITDLLHGAAAGADTYANEWGRRQHGVRVLPFPANWRKYGKRAGPIRNQRMVDEGKPDAVIAFPGGKGTADMIRRAEAAGIPVHRL